MRAAHVGLLCTIVAVGQRLTVGESMLPVEVQSYRSRAEQILKMQSPCRLRKSKSGQELAGGTA